MQAVNIECQIAQAQLRRYLTGEDMPSAVVNELETHLRNCPDCMAAAQTLRESLKGVLSSKISGKPEPRREEPAMSKAVATGKAAVQTPADVFDAPDEQFKHKPAKKKSNFKTLAYSGALALVLVLMSTIFKDPTALFGPRASEKRPDTPPKATEAEPKPTVNTPVETETAKTEPAQPETETPSTSTAPPTGEQPTGLKTDGFLIADGSTGTTVVKKDAPKKEEPKPQPTVPANRSPRKKPSGGGGNGIGTIKVYPPEK
jgi:hypothetical protein